MKPSNRLAAVITLLSFAAAACAADEAATTTNSTTTTAGTTTSTAPTTTTEPLPGADILACQISDFGGTDDASINESAWAGMERAARELGVAIEFLASNDEANYPRHLATFLQDGCDLIVTTGALLAYDTATAARNNPDRLFSIIDYPVGPFDPWGDPPPDNVRGLTFQSDEAAFLAGYLAAGVSQTHVLGTFGGLNIPPVTIYMEGFRQGARHYDAIHGTVTALVGWDGTDGLFTADFASVDKGQEFADDLIAAGADVILPVADRVGEGSCRAAAAATTDVLVIGIHWDWHFSAPDCDGVLLTSVLKHFGYAVFKTIENLVVVGDLGNEYVGTLANGGVGLAPFYELADRVPAELVAELAALEAAIIDGTVPVSPPQG